MKKLSLKKIKDLFFEAGRRFSEDELSRFAASLAYYAVFSLAPLLSIAIGVAGIVFGTTNAEEKILSELGSFLGPDGVELIRGVVHATDNAKAGAGLTAISFLFILLGASSVFKELKDAFNKVFEAPPVQGGFLRFLGKNLLSFGMVLSIGFLLLLSLLVSASLNIIGDYLGNILLLPAALWESLNFIVSFGITTMLFTLLYRYLSDVRVAWRESFWGALLTALLFTLGKTLIGIYLGRSGIASTYGAAGSIVLILLWVFYSAHIILFGAELVASAVGSSKKTSTTSAASSSPSSEKSNLPRFILSTVVLFIVKRLLRRFLRRSVK